MFHRRALRLRRVLKKTEQDGTTVPTIGIWKRPRERGRFSNWTKILLPIVPSIIFGVFTITFNIQQHSFFRETREKEQYQADAHHKRSIFDNYIDVILKSALPKVITRIIREYWLPERPKYYNRIFNMFFS